jgi:general L-amino acid transport system substrate-binding protein
MNNLINKPTKSIKFCQILTLLMLGFLSACTGSDQTSSGSGTSRLDLILQRRKLICGVSGEVPGFSYVDTSGKYSGIDVDICRAIASALFDNPEAVEYRNLSAKERFTALQTGEVDILSRNTTLTATLDTDTGLEFAPVIFYDGQGIMVRQDRKVKSLEDLKNAAICTQVGTTNELNLADQMRKRNIPYKPISFDDVNATFGAYEAGRCVAITTDRSGLSSRRTLLPKPNDHILLDLVLSKEPLAPAVRDGDSKWSNAVRWIIYAAIAAEELGITSKNLEKFGGNPETARFLGVVAANGKSSDLGKNMGLTNDFAARVVKHVGNYGEIYDRNLGPTTKLNIPRGLNKLWTNGGLMYAPPFR